MKMLEEVFDALNPLETIGLSFLIIVALGIAAYCFGCALYYGWPNIVDATKRLFKWIFGKGMDDDPYNPEWMRRKEYEETRIK